MKRRLVELEALQKISSALRLAETLEDMLPLFLDETLSLLNQMPGLSGSTTRRAALRFAVPGTGFPNSRVFHKIRRGYHQERFPFGEAYLSREFATDPFLSWRKPHAFPKGGEERACQYGMPPRPKEF